jgi:serine protease AprX
MASWLIVPAAFAQTKRHSQPAPTARSGAPSARVTHYKLDEVVQQLAGSGEGTSRVIVRLAHGAELPASLRRFAPSGGRLDLIGGQVLEVPNSALADLNANPDITQVHFDRPVSAFNYRTSVTVGATAVRETLGYTGEGIGVAIIDSGVAWHDDLTSGGVVAPFPYGDQRVAAFVDFVGSQTTPYDDNGHGTHVAGIIAGNGLNSAGQKAGIAPGASIVSLKVLDAEGNGTISNVIAALNWVAANHQAYNIRVVNVSVGAGVYESYWTDPFTLAVKALVDRGIVVVAAAGNLGKTEDGDTQFGGITAPGNAPWVLTVGASSTEGTVARADDTLAGYSSNGPTFLDFTAKPDLVAPGTGTVSLAVPGSHYYETKTAYLIDGTPAIGHKPYLSLTGTSMSAPVVSGTVALMLQANPALTPNLVKAILQYTAEVYPEFNPLRQGAGFLNTLGAVQLSAFFAANQVGAAMPVEDAWSRHIIWGNFLVAGGYINPRANAWDPKVVWGADAAVDGSQTLVWGTSCKGGCTNVVWSARDANGQNAVWTSSRFGNIVWGTARWDNIVWGTTASEDQIRRAGISHAGSIIWGTARRVNIVRGSEITDDDEGETDLGNIVWGTEISEDDEGFSNIVWGTDANQNALWAQSRFGNIVWGTARLSNIVWGTDCSGEDCDRVIWGDRDPDGVVWGTAPPDSHIVWGFEISEDDEGFSNIVWGTNGRGNIVWGTNGRGNIVWGTNGRSNIVWGTEVTEDDEGFSNIVWGTALDDPELATIFPEEAR